MLLILFLTGTEQKRFVTRLRIDRLYRTSSKIPVFLLPLSCPHRFTTCGLTHLVLYTALWSGSVIAGAV